MKRSFYDDYLLWEQDIVGFYVQVNDVKLVNVKQSWVGGIKMFVREKRELIKEGCREYLKLSVFFVDKRNNKHSTSSLSSGVMFALLHKHGILINNHFTAASLRWTERTY